MLVPWPGRPLASGERRDVQVRVETDRGTSAWSEPVAVEAGLLDAARLAGRLGLADRDRRSGRHPAGVPAARRGRRRPAGRAGPGSTRPRTASTSSSSTASGSATDELTPGLHRVRRSAPRCRPTTSPTCSAAGTHALGALLADGWYRGQVGILRAADQWGDADRVPRPAAPRARRRHAPPSSAPTPTWRWSRLAHPGRRPDRGPARGPPAAGAGLVDDAGTTPRTGSRSPSASAGTTRWSARRHRRCGRWRSSARCR